MLQKQALWLPGMQEEDLAVPENVGDLLEIQIPVNSTELEFEEMTLVNESGHLFVENEIDLDTYMDILDSVGIDPQFHLQEAAWMVANIFNY